MSKEELNIKEQIMGKIKSGEIKIKPKWYFIIGSFASIIGLVGTALVTIFFTNLFLFTLRTNSYRGYRLEKIILNFPWWALLIAVLGFVLGIYFLKKYDFSYKKNFVIIIVSIILSIFIAGWLFNVMGVNEVFIRKGMMKNIYRKYDGSGMMRMHNNWNNFRK